MSCNDTIFVGSNPSNSAATSAAFDKSTNSGKTFMSWLHQLKNINYIYTINISNIPTHNNRPLTAKEISYSLPALKLDIESIRTKSITNNLKIVAVGKTAAKALARCGYEFYELPHPSGLNRKLNNPQFIEEKIKGLDCYLAPNKE